MRRQDHSKKRRRLRHAAEEVALAAYSIDGFCVAHGISPMTYFRLRRRGEAPRTMKVGARTLISAEAAAAWRREREGAAAESASTA